MSLIGASIDDEVVHLALVLLTGGLMVISASGFRRRPTGRYLFLMIAFVFLCVTQVAALYEELFLGGILILVPSLAIHLDHLLELVTCVSFAAALLAPSRLWAHPQKDDRPVP